MNAISTDNNAMHTLNAVKRLQNACDNFYINHEEALAEMPLKSGAYCRGEVSMLALYWIECFMLLI